MGCDVFAFVGLCLVLFGAGADYLICMLRCCLTGVSCWVGGLWFGLRWLGVPMFRTEWAGVWYSASYLAVWVAGFCVLFAFILGVCGVVCGFGY